MEEICGGLRPSGQPYARGGRKGGPSLPVLERPSCCPNDSSVQLENQRFVVNEILLIVRAYYPFFAFVALPSTD